MMKMKKDLYGNDVCFVPLCEAVNLIAKRFINGNVKEIFVGEDTTNPDDPADLESVSFWSRIVRTDLPFDNDKDEILLMMGYMGGGKVATAYYGGNGQEDLCDFQFDIKKMIETVTECMDDDHVFLQLIEKEGC